jgi:hypothetical protein
VRKYAEFAEAWGVAVPESVGDLLSTGQIRKLTHLCTATVHYREW